MLAQLDEKEHDMHVSGITTTPQVAPSQSAQRQDLQALKQALQSGDLAGAQQAFQTFKIDFHQAHAGHSLYQTNVPAAVKQDLQSLQSALKSGDLAGAQQAFATFKQDFQVNQQQHQPEPPVGGGQPVPAQGSGVDVNA
jgi:TolA-binding protein